MDNNDKLKRLNLQLAPEMSRSRVRKNLLKKFQPILTLATVIIAGVFIWSIFSASSSVFQFAFNRGTPFKSTDDRVNILMLGLAGGKHDGALLTDSIIVASYHLKSHKVTLISIPRDLWLDSIKNKVNTAYEFGLRDRNGGDGLKFAEDKIDDILGFPIHYGVRIDFSGFSKAIDTVSGVDVEVPKTFDDYNYPITGKEDDLCGLAEKEIDLTDEKIKEIDPDQKLNLKPGIQKLIVDTSDKIATTAADFSCRFEHIHYDKGVSHMGGEIALKFVRSRMGTNGEGSDFARSRRQQLVLQAFRSKVLSLETLFNPQKVGGLINTFGQSFETDIETSRFLDFYGLLKKQSGVDNLVLGDLGNGKSVLEAGAPGKYGAYVLVPPNNDFSPVQEFLKKKLDEDAVLAPK